MSEVSLSETMTALMDKAREITGLTEKISISRLTSLMDHFDLHVNPNLLDKTNWVVNPNPDLPQWSTLRLLVVAPGTYTISWQATTTGTNRKVRVRFIDFDKNVVAPGEEPFGQPFNLTSDRTSWTFTVPDDGNHYTVALYGSDTNVNQTAPVKFYNVKLEHGDLATPLEKVGG